MALINCFECDREVSTQAEACPHCGCPVSGKQDSGPRCYNCPASATTKCQKCSTFSCPEHVHSIDLGKAGHELRCDKCYSDAEASKKLSCLFAIFLMAALLIMFLLTLSR